MASVKDQLLWNNSRKSWLLYIFLKLVCFVQLPFAITDNDDGEVPQTNNFSWMPSVLWAILLGILVYLMWKKYFGVLNANLVQINYDEHNDIPKEIIDEPCDEMRDETQNETNHELRDRPINEKRDDECDKASDERFNSTSNEGDVAGPEECNEIHNEARNELVEESRSEKLNEIQIRSECEKSSNELSDDSQCEQYIKSHADELPSVSGLQCQSNVAREKLCDDDLPSTSAAYRNERSFESSSVIVDDEQPSTSRGIQRLRALPVCIVEPVVRNGNSIDRSRVASATNRNKRRESNVLLRTHSIP
ncbi:uncharacterized protein LOC133848786 [Drosophila sulfurigaster albostrigata]|uniref:uncharacterized protein LOC133848786 n=1 Tax=Drosophila sulfurigaster albostrigata TaxID=89887 RepID=UPI002D219B71|nr:uncharacterized protein LOC133848786 [Drosophila sulfurigaster albostrigata]